MPWSGGQFTRIHDWVDDKNAGIPITASRMDADSDDFTSGINNCLAKDGSNTPTANLNIGSFRLTSVGPGTALTDAPTVNQVQAGVLNWGIASGTADALTVTFSPAQTTIADGTLVSVRAASANVTTAPTLAFNGTTARTITRYGGKPLRAGDILGALAESFLRYNSANTRWELLNPAKGQISILAKGTATAPADTSEDILATLTLAANTLGANGFITLRLWWTLTNDANAKTARARIGGIGGTTILSQNLAGVANFYHDGTIWNANATNVQVAVWPGGNSGGFAVQTTGSAAVDTTADTTIVVTMQKAVAGSAITLSYIAVLHSDGS